MASPKQANFTSTLLSHFSVFLARSSDELTNDVSKDSAKKNSKFGILTVFFEKPNMSELGGPLPRQENERMNRIDSN